MKIINLKKIEENKFKNKFDCLEIDINIENIEKIILEILYYHKKNNFKKFIINYNSNYINLSMSKVCSIIKQNLFKLLEQNVIKIYIKGITKCIFERTLLRPGLKWYFDEKLFFYKDAKANINFIKLKICNSCYYFKKCNGISKKYKNKNEIFPLISNQDLYPKYENKINNFKNLNIKNKYIQILNDYKNEKEYLRKKIIFVKSFPNNLQESSKERFVYFIYNKKEDFNKLISFFKIYFNEKFIEEFKNILKKSNEFALSFSLTGKNKIRNTFYFNIEDLNSKEIDKLGKLINISIIGEKYIGIGIDFREKEEETFKIYYKYKNIDVKKIEEFINKFDINKKIKILKFLKNNKNNFNQILLDYKFKNNKIYSKKIEFSGQFDKLNLEALKNEIDLSFLNDKELFNISFEISKINNEKINIYYALK